MIFSDLSSIPFSILLRYLSFCILLTFISTAEHGADIFREQWHQVLFHLDAVIWSPPLGICHFPGHWHWISLSILLPSQLALNWTTLNSLVSSTNFLVFVFNLFFKSFLGFIWKYSHLCPMLGTLLIICFHYETFSLITMVTIIENKESNAPDSFYAVWMISAWAIPFLLKRNDLSLYSC